MTGKEGANDLLTLGVGSAGSGSPALPRLRLFLGVQLSFYLAMRDGYETPHKIREPAEIACRILRGTLRVIRHSVPSPRRKDAVLREKSQSGFNKLLKQFHNRQDILRVDAKRINYAALASGIPISEHYAQGKLSLILHAKPDSDWYLERKRCAGASTNNICLPSFIFKLDVARKTVMEYWSQKPVLVSLVQLVHGPDGEIPLRRKAVHR